MTNFGLGLLQYASPGPRQNLGTTMINALDRYAAAKQRDEEAKRRKVMDDRNEQLFGFQMYDQNLKINDQARDNQYREQVQSISMLPEQQQMMQMEQQAKAGNPYAIQALNSMRQKEQQDFNKGMQLFDANYKLNKYAADSQKAGGGKGLQFGAQETFKDEQGNYFFGTTELDSSTPGGQRSILMPIGNGPSQPVGKVKKVNDMGQTTDEKLAFMRNSEEMKLRQARKSEMIKEISTRNRSAARSAAPIKEALRLVDTASQGLTGVVKLKLSQLLPGVDASNEGALDSALLKLALEQLQSFKGPTTDFEFGVAQSISGTLGQGAAANKARLKSLERNNWFMEREQKQLKQWLGSNKDPDDFRFNFNEEIKIGKNAYTLQQLQDTAVANHLSIEETLQRLRRVK